MKKQIVIITTLLLLTWMDIAAQQGCYGILKNDTLIIGNELIERKFLWNEGNLITHSITDKLNRREWKNVLLKPDFQIPDKKIIATKGSFNLRNVESNSIHPAYLECNVFFKYGALNIKKVFRVYSNCAAIACDIYMKGDAGEGWSNNKENTLILDRIALDGKHWRVKAVDFFDVTDVNNNLVKEYDALSYVKNYYTGNLLFMRNEEYDNGIFYLKEAPCSNVQLAYPGADFISAFGQFTVIGSGLNKGDIKKDEWVKTYGVVLGVFAGNEFKYLSTLRKYQKNLRKLLPGRDEMIMMNTWGDRSLDVKVNETFCLQEIEKAVQLGITHFQIDDGWQTGKSPASGVVKGSFKNIWQNPDYWKPDKTKYPQGLSRVIEKGMKSNIEICLWFNPSYQNDFEDWEKDAQALIDLNKNYGIRTFKIDGLLIPNKLSEIRVRKIFDKVLTEAGDHVVFNLDVTAGRRGGYHFFNEYGNIFLENRYTDFRNYYPFHTLRNLWMLSKYVPAEKIQIEFLNKWRNKDKYANDLFAPSNYSFEYLFATTMAAQPLAWFEASGLPGEAFEISSTIEQYKKIQHDFHSGLILPVGDEPSGKSWTGFQSINGNKGYLVIYRENNPYAKTMIHTWFPEGSKIKFTPVIGNGKKFTATAKKNGAIEVKLSNINDYALYSYIIN